MTNITESYKKLLDLVADFQTKAQKIIRYNNNPYVSGDNIAEHLSRISRLLVYISQDLKDEFPDNAGIIEDIFYCVIIHDDDEIISGFDIPTAIKDHNSKDDQEVEYFSKSVSSLDENSANFLISKFISFRKKDTLPAKIAKALDNISGNQLVVEQKIGLINPDTARFCIEYVLKVKGISKVIDSLVDAQINQIIEFREMLKLNSEEIENINISLNLNNSKKIKDLLDIDVTNHVLDKSKVYTPIIKL